jgi:AcrR family transcriptional regulator
MTRQEPLKAPSARVPKRARTRLRLVEAGLKVYAEQGDKITVLDVVREAGVSNGTFYNYFDDLEQLHQAVLVQILVGLGDAVAQSGPSDPAARFAMATLGILRRIREEPRWASVLVHLSTRPVMITTVLAHMRADLDAGRAEGRFAATADDIGFDIICGLMLVIVRRIAFDHVDDVYLSGRVQRLLVILGVDAAEAADLVANVPSQVFPSLQRSP